MNKVALITGGNGGIGKSDFIKLANKDDIVNYYSDYEGAWKQKTTCEKYKVNVMLYKCEVSNFDEVATNQNKWEELMFRQTIQVLLKIL